MYSFPLPPCVTNKLSLGRRGVAPYVWAREEIVRSADDSPSSRFRFLAVDRLLLLLVQSVTLIDGTAEDRLTGVGRRRRDSVYRLAIGSIDFRLAESCGASSRWMMVDRRVGHGIVAQQ